MPCTRTTLKMFGVTAKGLSDFFRACGYPLEVTIMHRRLNDQKWAYVHGALLKQIDLWEEPVFYDVSRNAAKLFAKHKFGGKYLGKIGSTNPDALGTVIEVKLPEDKE